MHCCIGLTSKTLKLEFSGPLKVLEQDHLKNNFSYNKQVNINLSFYCITKRMQLLTRSSKNQKQKTGRFKCNH